MKEKPEDSRYMKKSLLHIVIYYHWLYMCVLYTTSCIVVSVLSHTVDRCTLENNTLLHIDLPVSVEKESNPNIYSYAYAKTEQVTPPTWLLVTATVGVLLIILLVIVIIIIILRIRRLSKEERHPAATEVHHMQDKNMDHGSDV